MPILVIDTALDYASAAVVVDGAVQGASGAPSAGDAEAVVDHADRALCAAGVRYSELSRVAVTVGPGSFTGVRVGIAFAKGVAFGCRIPVIGVGTLEVIARQAGAGAGTVLATIDARHGSVFAALYEDGLEACAGRMSAADALLIAHEAAAKLAGPQSALNALRSSGTVVERLDPLVIAALSGGDPAGRAPTAVYFAPVDATPQGHKALARAVG